MISAVIQDNEESVGPLAEGEVARLLSALNNAEFTRSNKHDLAKNSRFKQRSLIEIAAEAKKHEDAIKADEQNPGDNIDGHNNEVKFFSDDQSDSLSKENLEAVKTNELAPEQTIRDISSKQKMNDEAPEASAGVRGLSTNSPLISGDEEKERGIRGLMASSPPISGDEEPEPGVRGLTTNSPSISGNEESKQGIRGLTTKSTSISESEEPETGIRGLTSVSHGENDYLEKAQEPSDLTSSPSGFDEQTAKNSFETVNEAFERGKTEGVSEGRTAAIAETKERAMADAKAELADIVDTFKNALDTLARPKAMHVEELSTSINTAILKLASQRAGIQIDEFPSAFSDRITTLVKSIAKEIAEGEVHLNEEDYATMKPFLADLGFEVFADSNLMRGDVTLKFDGVEVHDVATNRMARYSDVKLNDTADDHKAADDMAAISDSSAVDDMAATSDSSAVDDMAATSDSSAVHDIDAAGDNAAADDNADLSNVVTGDLSKPQSDEPSS